MKLRRILSVLLTLCLLTTFLPPRTVAAQAEKQDPPYTGMRDSGFYPTIDIQEVTPEPEKAPGESDNIWDGTETYAQPYLPVDQVAFQLREYMKARKTEFQLLVKSTEGDVDKVAEELLNKATAHTGNPIEGDYLLWHCQKWGGSVFGGFMNGEYAFTFNVQMSYYTNALQEQEMTVAVNNLLSSLNVYYKSNYEKVKAVYDYICQNITYDYEHLPNSSYTLMFSAYAALINKTAVCQGYATLLYRLLLSLGVDCRVITGLAITGEPHAWNIIKLGNVYYNADSTWDAQNDPYMFFLRNSEMNATHYRDLECNTTQFHMDYPMSATNYVDGVAGEPDPVIVTGICGDAAYWTLDREGKLTIAGTGTTYDVLDNITDLTKASPWIYWKESINTLIVEEGITALGKDLFMGHHNLANVTLPESLVSIGSQTFRNCDNLTYFCFPNGLKTIGHMAFYSCDNLKTVTFGNSLDTIGRYSFGDCSSLQDIVFPESLTTIESDAFRSCDALTEVTIPQNVTYLGSMAFYSCNNLQSVYIYNQFVSSYAFSVCDNLRTVVLSEHVTYIGQDAFSYCPALKEITIPKSVTAVDRIAFRCSESLAEIRFKGDAPTFAETTFEYVTATVYYPAGYASWTEEVLQNYGGTITWVPYCPGHEHEPIETTVTCTESGSTTYKCIHCEDSYVEDGIPATGHLWSDGPCNQPIVCTVCGENHPTGEIPAMKHQWSEGSCDQPRSCTVCGESSGANGHVYDDGVDGTCNFCNIDRVETVDRIVVHMFRMYNPNTGEHFYTGSEEERDNLIGHGWQYEGIGFTFPANTGVPVHRLFHEPTGEHLYTMDEEEKARLMAEGWNYEGVAFNSAYDTEAVQYRLYNPNTTVGAYHFTHSEEERQNLLDVGWQDQGIGWYSCWK